MSRRSTRITAASNENAGIPSAQSHVLPTIATASVSSSLYLQNYYSHPANTRLLIGNLSQTGGKRHGAGATGRAVPKPPKPPEKPTMPYMRYSRKVWDEVKANNGKQELKLWEVGKIIGQMWRELPAPDRQQYMEEYEIEKMQHVELLKAYQTSPEYQAYIHAKTRAEAIEAATEGLGGDKDDAYMSIEPIDETVEDSDMCYSVKHVAAARFQRNHRLINDILGEAIHVPSTRAVVTTQRLNVLKNQVHSLELHQKKLENELIHLEEAHVGKKRKWIDQAREFGREMKRLRGITPQEYYKEYKQKQQSATAQQKQQEEAKKEKMAKEKAVEASEQEPQGKSDDKTEPEKKDESIELSKKSAETKEEPTEMMETEIEEPKEESSATAEVNTPTSTSTAAEEDKMEVEESSSKTDGSETTSQADGESVTEKSEIETAEKDTEEGQDNNDQQDDERGDTVSEPQETAAEDEKQPAETGTKKDD